MPEIEVEKDPEALRIEAEFKVAMEQFQIRLKDDIYAGLLMRGLTLVILFFMFGLFSFSSVHNIPPGVSRLLEFLLIR